MQIREIKLKLRVLVEPDDDGSFHAFCPDFKGLHVFGDSQSQALENIRQALALYATSLVKHDDAIPVGVMFSDTTHGSLTGFIWESVKRNLSLHAPKSYVQEIRIPAQACA